MNPGERTIHLAVASKAVSFSILPSPRFHLVFHLQRVILGRNNDAMWATPPDVAMTILHHDFRRTWVALLAIVGSLVVIGEGSACTSTNPEQVSTRSCCVGRSCTLGCCSIAPMNGQGFDRAKAASATIEPRISQPSTPCECRRDGSPLPVSRTEPRSSDRLNDPRVVSGVAMVFEPYTPSLPARSILPFSLPPSAPLYLRTSHLLI